MRQGIVHGIIIIRGGSDDLSSFCHSVFFDEWWCHIVQCHFWDLLSVMVCRCSAETSHKTAY